MKSQDLLEIATKLPRNYTESSEMSKSTEHFFVSFIARNVLNFCIVPLDICSLFNAHFPC